MKRYRVGIFCRGAGEYFLWESSKKEALKTARGEAVRHGQTLTTARVLDTQRDAHIAAWSLDERKRLIRVNP